MLRFLAGAAVVFATAVPLWASAPSILKCCGAVSNADTRKFLSALDQRDDLALPPPLLRVLRTVGVRRMMAEERFSWKDARASMAWRFTSLITDEAPGDVRRRLKTALTFEGLHENSRGSYLSSPTQCATIVDVDGFLAQPDSSSATGWTMTWTVSSMEMSVAPHLDKLLAAVPSLGYGRVPSGVLERLNSLEVGSLSVGRDDWDVVVRISDHEPLVASLTEYLKAEGFERMTPKAGLIIEYLRRGTYVSIQYEQGSVRVHVAPHS